MDGRVFWNFENWNFWPLSERASISFARTRRISVYWNRFCPVQATWRKFWFLFLWDVVQRNKIHCRVLVVQNVTSVIRAKFFGLKVDSHWVRGSLCPWRRPVRVRRRSVVQLTQRPQNGDGCSVELERSLRARTGVGWLRLFTCFCFHTNCFQKKTSCFGALEKVACRISQVSDRVQRNGSFCPIAFFSHNAVSKSAPTSWRWRRRSVVSTYHVAKMTSAPFSVQVALLWLQGRQD